MDVSKLLLVGWDSKSGTFTPITADEKQKTSAAETMPPNAADKDGHMLAGQDSCWVRTHVAYMQRKRRRTHMFAAHVGCADPVQESCQLALEQADAIQQPRLQAGALVRRAIIEGKEPMNKYMKTIRHVDEEAGKCGEVPAGAQAFIPQA